MWANIQSPWIYALSPFALFMNGICVFWTINWRCTSFQMVCIDFNFSGNLMTFSVVVIWQFFVCPSNLIINMSSTGFSHPKRPPIESNVIFFLLHIIDGFEWIITTSMLVTYFGQFTFSIKSIRNNNKWNDWAKCHLWYDKAD